MSATPGGRRSCGRCAARSSGARITTDPGRVEVPRSRLTLVRGYLGKLLDNGRVVLAQQARDILAEFQRLVESKAAGADP